MSCRGLSVALTSKQVIVASPLVTAGARSRSCLRLERARTIHARRPRSPIEHEPEGFVRKLDLSVTARSAARESLGGARQRYRFPSLQSSMNVS